jgi:hypothetical protein
MNMPRSHKEIIVAKRAIALAKLIEFRRQCGRLAHLAAEGIVDRVDATDSLYDAAVAHDLIGIHGEDFIAGVLATAFEWSAAWSATQGRAA